MSAIDKPTKYSAAEDYSAAVEDESAANILTYASGWFSSLRSRASLGTQLAMAEAKLAAMSFALMTFIGVVAAVLFLSAWGLVVAGAVIALLDAGVALWIIMLSLAVVHLLGAALLAFRFATLSRNMSFTQTRSFIQREVASEEVIG